MPRTDANGVSLYYELEGTGQRLLVISGTGGDLRQQPRVSDGPLAENFEVLAYDQRGLGQSSLPPWPYAMGDFADDAAALLDALGWDDCGVLGISFGGMVAQEVAIRHPERVRRLVLACTSAGGAGGASYPLQNLFELRSRGTVSRAHGTDRHPLGRGLAEGEPRHGATAERTYASRRSGRDPRGPDQSAGGAGRARHGRSPGLHCLPYPRLRRALRRDRPAGQQRVPGPRHPRGRLEMFDGGHGFFIQDAAALPAIISFLAEDAPAHVAP